MPTRQTALTTAGEAVGLLAAAVAGLYILGGAVLALRLAFDHFPVEAIVALVGQLPRELLITIGLLEAVAPAVIIGVCAGLLYAAFDRPKKDDTLEPALEKATGWPFNLLLLAVLAAVLVAPGVWIAITTDGIQPLLLTSLLGWAVTFASVVLGWYLLRRTRRTTWSRLGRASAAGGIWAVMALTGGVMIGAAVPFERASVCVKGSAVPKTGELIADTKDRVIMGTSAGGRRVVNIPAAMVERVRYGNIPPNLACE